MAIDVAEKRRAISHIHLMAAGPGVTPNASKDLEWRQEAGYGYPSTAGVVAAVTERTDIGSRNIMSLYQGYRKRM